MAGRSWHIKPFNWLNVLWLNGDQLFSNGDQGLKRTNSRIAGCEAETKVDSCLTHCGRPVGENVRLETYGRRGPMGATAVLPCEAGPPQRLFLVMFLYEHWQSMLKS